MKIGILAIQGDYEAHAKTLDRLGVSHTYVRRPEDLSHIDQELRRAIGPEARALYLKADICRRDLLVEIEALGS